MEWISVKDSLSGCEPCKVKLSDGSVINNVLRQFDGDYYWKTPTFGEIFICEFSVTHWMPLPESPKAEILDCPHCPNQGWFVDYDYYTGEPEQVQCEFCECEPRSRFNSMRSGNDPKTTQASE